MKCFLILLSLVLSNVLFGQNLKDQIESKNDKINLLKSQIKDLQAERESLKLEKVIADMDKIGYPKGEHIKHSGMVLSYSEKHEQAAWVMHMILPDIQEGTVFRSNDFRADPKVKTGTAVQIDYFLTDTLANGKVQYDGFGYDRGHLAPSADFRWSAKALSESYYYSNMSPQAPEFNREQWADLENHLRSWVIENKVPLYVVTAPKLNEKLSVIDRSINKVAIPKQFAKFVYDPSNNRSIAFIMWNNDQNNVLESHAMSVDEAEEIFGLDVFTNIDAKESDYELKDWFDNLNHGNVEALDQEHLPRNCFNTIIGAKRIGKKSRVCGRVVSTKISRSGHLWLNLDKKFPNQLFSIFIRKNDLVHFSYDAQKYLEQAQVCFEGKVKNMNGTATININRENQVELLKDITR